MATAEQKEIVEFYISKYKETGDAVYKNAAEHWGKKFGIRVKFEEERKKEEKEEKEGE